MNQDERLKATIIEAKERKNEFLMQLQTCNREHIEMVMSLTEALALVELRAQQLYIVSLRNGD